jgi:hypothetical protein
MNLQNDFARSPEPLDQNEYFGLKTRVRRGLDANIDYVASGSDLLSWGAKGITQARQHGLTDFTVELNVNGRPAVPIHHTYAVFKFHYDRSFVSQRKG